MPAKQGSHRMINDTAGHATYQSSLIRNWSGKYCCLKFNRNIIYLILNVLCWTQTNYPGMDLGWPSNIHPAAANIL